MHSVATYNQECGLRSKFLGFLSMWLSIGLTLAVAAPASSGFRKASNVVLPIYNTNTFELRAVLRVKQVYPGQKKVGFFRVKLLPQIVGEGVRLEFSKSGLDGSALPEAQKIFLALTRAQEFELKDVAFCFPGEMTPRLEARRILPAAAGAPGLQLEGVRLPGKDHELLWPRASLQIQADGEICVVSATRAATVTFKLFEGNFSTNHVKSSGEPK